MMKNNYLFDFADKLDCLISEINKLNAKVRLYRKNSSKFNFDFNVKFTISPDCFENLRNYLYEKIEEGSVYNKKIVDLKREFAKEYLYLIFKIKQEIRRIDDFQEKEMNRIVYQKIYAAKYEFELKQINRYKVDSSVIEKFLGINKYNKLMIKNHELKSKIVLKEYDQESIKKKSVFELICMIENANIKTGEILCLQDDMIENFMIDRSTIKRSADYSWKCAEILPNGFFAKKEYYKMLNNLIKKENKELEEKLLEEDRLTNFKEVRKNKLHKMNEKLSKILNTGVVLEQ